MPVALASMPMPSYISLQQKGDGLGCLISSQNTIEGLLISSPPSKRTVKQKKVIFCTFLLFKLLDEFFMGIAIF
jgi:hypothetical protein